MGWVGWVGGWLLLVVDCCCLNHVVQLGQRIIHVETTPKALASIKWGHG